jgi:hypothetical protein
VIKRSWQLHHHLFPDLQGSADTYRVRFETLRATKKMIDLAILDPHEIQIMVDKETDIAVPEARCQEKFRIPVQTLPDGIGNTKPSVVSVFTFPPVIDGDYHPGPT